MSAIAGYSSQYTVWNTEEIGYLECARNMENSAQKTASGEMPAINVVLSPESLEAAAKHNAALFAQAMQGRAADGSGVSVQRSAGIYAEKPDVSEGYINTDALVGYVYTASLGTSDGSALSFDFTGDVRAGKNAAGNWSVYFSESNTTRLYAADGSYVEKEGDLTEADGDAVIFSVGGGSLNTGNGNNLVFVYGDNASIQGGSGDDDIHLAGNVRNVKINSGAGNDSVSGGTVYDLDLALNDGDNNVNIAKAVGGNYSAGDGNNTFEIGTAAGANIDLGNGDNTYKGYALSQGAGLNMGNGNNSLDLYEVGQKAHPGRPGSSASVNLGNGNNRIDIYNIQERSGLNVGHGDNDVDIYSIITGGSLSLGNGNNDLLMYGLKDDASASIGNGNNNIHMYELEGNSSFSAGDGSNNMLLYALRGNSTLSLGDGDNRVKLYELLENSLLEFGDGNNQVLLHEMEGNSRLSFGDGNNLAMLGAMYGNAMLSMGQGNNALLLERLLDNAKVTAGDGDNDFKIGRAGGNSSISVGDGNNSLEIGELTEQASVSLGEGENLVLPGRISGSASIFREDGTDYEAVSLETLDQEQRGLLLEQLTARRNERRELGTPSVSDFEDDDFSNGFLEAPGPDYGWSEVGLANQARRSELEGIRNYLKASVADGEKLTHELLPERIRQHIDDASVFDNMNYLWYDPK